MRDAMLGLAAAAVARTALPNPAGAREGGHWGGHAHWRGYYYPWVIGLGLAFAWPTWSHATYYPYYIEYPIGEVSERLDPEPMPYRPPARTQSYRFYCPPAAAYYPDVKTCAQPWLKVLPQDAGPAGPPTDRDTTPGTEEKPQQ